MGATPDQLKADIERTRGRLTADVDTLTDRLSPRGAVRRRASAVADKAGSVTSRAGSRAGSMAETVQGAPDTVRSRTSSNPLAFGLIAFGTGLLAAAALPTTSKEEELAGQAKTRAGEVTEPLKRSAKQTAQQLRANLEPAAMDAVEQVKGTATGAAERTKRQAKSSAGEVATTAKRSGRTVKSRAKSAR